MPTDLCYHLNAISQYSFGRIPKRKEENDLEIMESAASLCISQRNQKKKLASPNLTSKHRSLRRDFIYLFFNK